MKKEIKQILKIEDGLDKKISEIERIILLPVENELKVSTIRSLLNDIKVEFVKTRYDSLFDKPTGLLNKNGLTKMYAAKLREAIEKGMHLSVIVSDINFLKKYNDAFGHLAGDIVIKQYSEVIKNSLRKADIAFRYGGDEFVLICVHKKANDVKIIVERTRENNSILNNSIAHPFNVSIGYATSKKQEKISFKKLFEKADSMLYQDKRNNVEPDFSKIKIDEK